MHPYQMQAVNGWGWEGFKKSYAIDRVSQGKTLCLLQVVVWVKKGLKHDYVIYEWSLRSILVYLGVAMTKKSNSCPK